MSYMKCAVGDEFKFVGQRGDSGCGSFDSEPSAVYIRITNVSSTGRADYEILDINKKKLDYCAACLTSEERAHTLEKVNGLMGKLSKSMTTMIEAWKLSRKPEPQKTFIKAGVTEENGDFTSEGKLLFNAFLLEKYGDEFKKEVVDPLLEAQENNA